MSDVIEVMARALDDGDYPMATYRRDVIDMLEAAEKAGWRLVPVEPDSGMKQATLPWIPLSQRGNVIRAAIQAAPRPWEHNHG